MCKFWYVCLGLCTYKTLFMYEHRVSQLCKVYVEVINGFSWSSKQGRKGTWTFLKKDDNFANNPEEVNIA